MTTISKNVIYNKYEKPWVIQGFFLSDFISFYPSHDTQLSFVLCKLSPRSTDSVRR
jgi:hypothetical protein